MEPLPHILLKIAREFLGLSQDEVVALIGVGRSTIQKIERGEVVTEVYISVVRQFYENQGIRFLAPAEEQGWGLRNANVSSGKDRLNRLSEIPAGRRKKETS
ncbi:helix-turn-helix transcriptional regulator [Aliirhizobium terrae]|uniref:helix-turn-helix transcriptional regulator n=1 Tax=Terrirhizobium terrae TaxID=2926709 RepID=UPI002577CC3A|nr:helix-turn-helix transcriptional regulator [Rhizobium sp. CC-CFT758]WJH40599.1 helix-turn-helix transcriptional regulator [Rhizobium sp. CC-CFT758]